MITPDQALRRILVAARPLPAHKVSSRNACGLVLAAQVRAADDLPRFDNSAVDGYAVNAAETRNASEASPVLLRVVGEVHAGSLANLTVGKGCAARISTGACIPKGTNAVVMQEDCVCDDMRVLVKCREAREANIRRRGEEIRKGQIALSKGTLLNSGSVAWLATMGVKAVLTHRPVQVGLLRSGNEVVEWDAQPRPHQVRDAHGISLGCSLRALGLQPLMLPIVRDNLACTLHAFRKLLATCDVVITTGGVSVGKRDWLHEAAQRLGVKQILHGIAQRPGKPMAFGRCGAKLWFGLPGNPVSSLVCFHLYVQPALLKMTGHRDPSPRWLEARAAHSMCSDPWKTVFARGNLRDGVVSLSEKQGSHCLGSFAEANVIVRLAPSQHPVRKGAKVLCISLTRI